MREIQNAEIRARELHIMKTLTDYIDAHGLHYYLAYGSLLGAIRHKGYIPWDNDMDIAMPRPDYEKLLELLKVEPLDHGYVPINSMDGNCAYPFTNIVDKNTKVETDFIAAEEYIWVDVFPLDGAPGDEEEWERSWTKANKLSLQHFKSRYPLFKGEGFFRTLLKTPYILYLHMLGPIELGKRLNENAKRYDWDESEYCYQYVYCFLHIQRMKKEWFGEGTFVPFESFQFKVPDDYTAVLLNRYGEDYMELPPEDKRQINITRAWVLDDEKDIVKEEIEKIIPTLNP